MRTRAVLGGVFASFAILVIGWQAGSAALTAPSAQTSTSQPLAGAGTATASGSSTTPASVDGTFTGSSVMTRFGAVQVAVTVSGGAITDVTPIHLTDDGRRSVQISNRAAPLLREEVIAAQSATVSNVGGATYTTDAYLASVQSALDKAGL